jgi:hypothetical protein
MPVWPQWCVDHQSLLTMRYVCHVRVSFVNVCRLFHSLNRVSFSIVNSMNVCRWTATVCEHCLCFMSGFAWTSFVVMANQHGLQCSWWHSWYPWLLWLMVASGQWLASPNVHAMPVPIHASEVFITFQQRTHAIVTLLSDASSSKLCVTAVVSCHVRVFSSWSTVAVFHSQSFPWTSVVALWVTGHCLFHEIRFRMDFVVFYTRRLSN